MSDRNNREFRNCRFFFNPNDKNRKPWMIPILEYNIHFLLRWRHGLFKISGSSEIRKAPTPVRSLIETVVWCNSVTSYPIIARSENLQGNPCFWELIMFYYELSWNTADCGISVNICRYDTVRCIHTQPG